MFGTKKKQRSALPEKQQLTKYYEMDGALRAYANRMALLGMTCGVFALGTLALFAYVRLQPPVVIRVDNSGEATVVGGDTVRVGANGLMGLLKVSASGPENSPGEVEGRAVVRKFLTSYLTYTPANVERQYADALNMMTANLRMYSLNLLRDQDLIGKINEEQITSSFKIRSIEPILGQPWTYQAFGVKEVHRVRNKSEFTDRIVGKYYVRLIQDRRTERVPSGLLVAEYKEEQMVGDKDIGLLQESTLLGNR